MDFRAGVGRASNQVEIAKRRLETAGHKSSAARRYRRDPRCPLALLTARRNEDNNNRNRRIRKASSLSETNGKEIRAKNETP